MQVKIEMIPDEPEKETARATIRVYDHQGILTEGDINLSKDQKEATVRLGENGYIEMDDIGAATTVDGEQFAGVPDSVEEVEKRRREKEEQRLRRAMEMDPMFEQRMAMARGAPYPGGQTTGGAAPFPKAAETHVDKKGEKADFSKAPDSSAGSSPRPPGIESGSKEDHKEDHNKKK